MNYVFVQLAIFRSKAKKIGISSEDMRQMELIVMEGAKAGPVMAGTNGLRKIRFAPEATGAGKSGGVRICYVVLEKVSYVYFVTLFSKNEQDNLEKSQRNMIAALIGQLKKFHKEQE